MKWLISLMLLLLVLILPGCGGARSGDEAEDTADAITEADTANIDANSNPENLPAINTDPTDQAIAQNSVTPPSTPENNIAEVAPPVQTPDFKPEQTRESENTGDLGTYTVKRGDTLMKIAYNMCGDISKWKDIYNLNSEKLHNANVLAVGTNVKYPKSSNAPNIDRNGDPYMIKHGDTLGTIASDLYGHRSKWKVLYENNRSLIKNPNKIYAGFYIYYQKTEQEKVEKENMEPIKSEPQKLSNTESLPDSAMIKKEPKKVGGLNALSTGINQRSPASNKN